MKTLVDYIKVYPKKISETFCDLIVNEYKDSSEWNEPYIGDDVNKIDYTKRKCSIISTSQLSVLDKNPTVRKQIDNHLFEVITDCLNEYNKNFISGSLNITSDTGYTLLRYKPGEYITQHVDASTDISRVLSCSIGLNSDYTGGRFAFFNREIEFTLGKGDVVIFPSNFLYPHEILPVTSGVRYSMLSWLF